MESALATFVQIPSGALVKSLLEIYENTHGTNRFNSIILTDEILTQRQWEMPLRLHLPIPSGCNTCFYWKSVENSLGTFWSNSFAFLHLTCKVNGKMS